MENIKKLAVIICLILTLAIGFIPPMASAASETTLGSKAVGSIVKLQENGQWADYLVVQQGNPDPALYDSSCDGTWLLRKEIFERLPWNSSNYNDYANSTIHYYLNSTFLARFSSSIQTAVKQVKIPYRPGAGKGTTVSSGSSGLSTKVFFLSAFEIGWTFEDNLYFPIDGTKLSYFDSGSSATANSKRIALGI